MIKFAIVTLAAAAGMFILLQYFPALLGGTFTVNQTVIPYVWVAFAGMIASFYKLA